MDVSVVKQPAYAGSALAVVTAACVMGVLASEPIQLSIAGIEAIGSLLLLGSGLVRRRGHRLLGGGLVIVGCGLVCLTLGVSLVVPVGLFERIAFFSGSFAMICVLLGVYPLRKSWARGFVSLGVALFSCSLVFLVWVSNPNSVQILLGVGLTIVTWDMGEHAITLGDDVGRSAQTFHVTIAHFAGSLGVGLAAGTVALIVSRVELPALPIATLALLLGAVLLLLLVLFLGDSEWFS